MWLPALRFCILRHMIDPNQPGEQRILDIAWRSDQVMVVLEISPTQDSEVCTLYTLLVDLEKAGLVETTLSGHSCQRPAGSLDSDHDSFEVAPMDGGELYFKFADTRQFKFTSGASAFAASSLRASPRLQEVWRMQYVRQDKELCPRKPLWYLREGVKLSKGSCLRLI